jgi:PAS domain S-box-containing protein
MSQAGYESSRMWEVSHELLATVRSDGCLQQINPRWHELLGWDAEELLERPFLKFVHPDDVGRSAREMDQLRTGASEKRPFENRYRCRDGSYRRVIWNSLASDTDNLIYSAGRDVTDLRLQEATLRETAAEVKTLSEDLEERVIERTSQLATANKELEAFSYSVSHDLRAPLRAINGYSQAVLEDYVDEIPEGAKSDLARVRAASQRMATMIDEMLALSRVTRRALLCEPVDLTEMAEEVAEDLRREEPARDVEILVDPGMQAIGDPVLLQQVVHNLLENAWKFTSETEHPKVVIARTGESTFVVTDNGAGFDMRYADKLFRPFERLHRQEEFSGTGVGLATVARILNRHGGGITAMGAPGEGASFTFDVPDPKEPNA